MHDLRWYGDMNRRWQGLLQRRIVWPRKDTRPPCLLRTVSEDQWVGVDYTEILRLQDVSRDLRRELRRQGWRGRILARVVITEPGEVVLNPIPDPRPPKDEPPG